MGLESGDFGCELVFFGKDPIVEKGFLHTFLVFLNGLLDAAAMLLAAGDDS